MCYWDLIDIDNIVLSIVQEFVKPENYHRLDEQKLASSIFYSFAIGVLNNNEIDEEKINNLQYVVEWLQEKKNILNEEQDYYIISMPGEVKVMVPTQKAEEIGVRSIIDKNDVSKVLNILDESSFKYASPDSEYHVTSPLNQTYITPSESLVEKICSAVLFNQTAIHLYSFSGR